MKLTTAPKLNPHIGKPLADPVIPQDFILVVDTREQLPLFNQVNGLIVIYRALPFGDYSIKGFESRICFERKKLSDFYTYIGKDREKTTVKMMEFKKIQLSEGFVGLVIEADEADVLAGFSMSTLSPETARQALVSFEVRYGVHVYYSRSRKDIERWILDRAIKWYRIQREVD